MKTQFIEEFVPIQQKGRRIPIHLHERVEEELLNKLYDRRHIIKLDKCADKQFISPIVITVKKDQLNLRWIRRKSINLINKNMYPMPNIDLLLNNIAQVVKSDKTKPTLISKLDLRYAYSQIPLDRKTREQCNFSLVGGNATGTY